MDGGTNTEFSGGHKVDSFEVQQRMFFSVVALCPHGSRGESRKTRTSAI